MGLRLQTKKRDDVVSLLSNGRPNKITLKKKKNTRENPEQYAWLYGSQLKSEAMSQQEEARRGRNGLHGRVQRWKILTCSTSYLIQTTFL